MLQIKKNRLLAKKGLTTCTIYCIMQAERLKKETKGKGIRGINND